MKKLVLILLMSLFVTSSFADQIIWSANDILDNTDCSGGDCANDTILISGSGISAGSKALDITDMNDLTIYVVGKTITYTGIGVSIHDCDDLTIVGGVWSGGATGIKLDQAGGASDNMTIKDVTLTADGDNAKCVFGNGFYNLEIDGGTFTNEGMSFDSRCAYDAPVMKFNHLYSEDTLEGDFQYHVYVHDVTITDGPWAGITVLADESGSDNALAIIESNTITTDHRNTSYPSYSGLCNSSANPYGIILRNGADGSKIRYNNITSGTNYGGNRGIMLERCDGESDNPILITGNTLNLHEGENVEFAIEDGPCYGIRVRYFNEYVLIDSNNITVTVDTDAGTDHIAHAGQGMALTVDASIVHITVQHNTIELISLDAGSSISHASCMNFMKIDYPNQVKLYHNNLTSPNIIYQFGHKNASDEAPGSVYIEGDTISISGSYLTDKTINMNWLCNTWYHYGNELRDIVYNGSSAYDDINFTCGATGQHDIQVTRTLNLYAKGANGLPVVGATITAENAYGATVFNETTNYYGKTSDVVTYYYESNTWTDSTAFNDFTLTATYGDDDASQSFTVGYTAAGGTDTLLLPNTDGDGEWGEPEVPENDPPSFVNGVTAVSVTPVDRDNANTTVISAVWTDVDDPGVDSFRVSFKLRYPNNITEIILVDSQYNGSGGLTIVEDSTGWYTATYTYDPASDQTLGDYDLYTYVTDGTNYDVDAFSNNIDELTISEALSLSQTLTVIDTTTDSVWIEVDFANQSALDSVYLLFGTANPPTTHQDSILSPSDPDTFIVAGLADSTTYYYRTIAVDAVSRDTSSVGTILTYTSVTHSLTTIDSGADYESYFHVEDNYRANTVTSLKMVYGTSTDISASSGDTTITTGITDPDTLYSMTGIATGLWYYWFILTDETGTDTSSMGTVNVTGGGLRFGTWGVDETNWWYTCMDRQRTSKYLYSGPTGATLDSIYFYLNLSVDAKNATCAVYNNSSGLVDTSEERSIDVTGARWWGFDMMNADTLTAGDTLRLVIWADAGAGDLLTPVYVNTGFTYYVTMLQDYTGKSWPDPITYTDTVDDMSLTAFGVYSEGATPTELVTSLIRRNVIIRKGVRIK